MPRHTQNKNNFDNAKAKSALNPKLLIFLKQPEHHSTIQQFWQGIENRKAKTAGKKPKTISVKSANRIFFRALQASANKSPYAKDAEELCRRLLHPLKVPPMEAQVQRQWEQVNKNKKDDIKVQVKRMMQDAIVHFQRKAQELSAARTNHISTTKNSLIKKQSETCRFLADALSSILRRIDTDSLLESLNDPKFAPSPQHPLRIAYEDYESLIYQAAKNGLGDDPYVRNWLVNHENPKDAQKKKIKPITEKEVPIYNAIDDMWDQGISWREMHRELITQGIMPRKNWSAFYKWIARRGFFDTYGRKNEKL